MPMEFVESSDSDGEELKLEGLFSMHRKRPKSMYLTDRAPLRRTSTYTEKIVNPDDETAFSTESSWFDGKKAVQILLLADFELDCFGN